MILELKKNPQNKFATTKMKCAIEKKFSGRFTSTLKMCGYVDFRNVICTVTNIAFI